MRFRIRSYVAIVLIALSFALVPCAEVQAEKPSCQHSVAEALHRRVSAHFTGIPLAEALKKVAEQARVDILLDPSAFILGRWDKQTKVWLTAEQVELRDEQAPVWLEAADVSLHSALNLLLRQQDLEFVVRETHLEVTTPDKAAAAWRTQVYPVHDLMDHDGYEGELTSDQVIDTIQQCVAPLSWDTIGGDATINPVGASLWITQSDANHQQIGCLLAALRGAGRCDKLELASPDATQAACARDQEAAAPFRHVARTRPTPIVPAAQAGREQKLEKLLNQPLAEVSLVKSPLVDALAYLGTLASVPLHLDRKALAESGIALDLPVTASLRKVRLKDALRQCLEPRELTFVVQDEVILVTTFDATEEIVTTVVYPLGDIVPDEPFPDEFTGGDVVDAVTSIQPSSWDAFGGAGSALYFAPTRCLVVRQRPDFQKQVGQALAKLRAATPQISPEERRKRQAERDQQLVWQGFRWRELPEVVAHQRRAAEVETQKPPEPLTAPERETLLKVLREAWADVVTDESKPLVVVREYEILVRLPRVAMIALERNLQDAPVSLTMPDHLPPKDGSGISVDLFIPQIGETKSSPEPNSPAS